MLQNVKQRLHRREAVKAGPNLAARTIAGELKTSGQSNETSQTTLELAMYLKNLNVFHTGGYSVTIPNSSSS